MIKFSDKRENVKVKRKLYIFALVLTLILSSFAFAACSQEDYTYGLSYSPVEGKDEYCVTGAGNTPVIRE